MPSSVPEGAWSATRHCSALRPPAYSLSGQGAVEVRRARVAGQPRCALRLGLHLGARGLHRGRAAERA
jgi:hypothetical protein